MDINKVKNSLCDRAKTGFEVYERRPGKYQLIVPICYEDGDMVDIYLQDSPKGGNHIRICDYGMALMRLSYTYEISTDSRQRIFDSILINNGVQNDRGNLYLDASSEMLYEGILQFAGCVQKVCNMRYWSREIVRSTFYEDLKKYTTTELQSFTPKPDIYPLPDYDIIGVDWSLTHNNRNLYLFGVHSNDKAKNAAILLLELQKANLPFISLIVHEDMEELGRKERLYLTRNADKQYPSLNDFQEMASLDIPRLAS